MTARNLADQDSKFRQQIADALDKENSLAGATTSVHFDPRAISVSSC
jgi:hypothetical protein